MTVKDRNKRESTMRNNAARKRQTQELEKRVSRIERWIRLVEKTFQRA